MEIINAIVKDIGGSHFSVPIDELHDMSSFNQLAIVICFVDKGHVIEPFYALYKPLVILLTHLRWLLMISFLSMD